MADLAGKQRRLVRLEADAFDTPEEPVACGSLAAADEVDIDDLGQQALELTRAHPHRDQQVVLAGGILGEAGGPLGGGKAGGEIVGREDGDGAARLRVRLVHLEDEVALEVPVLEEDRVALLFQHPGDPGRPGAVSLVEADEEIALVVRRIGHASRHDDRRTSLSRKAPYHRRSSAPKGVAPREHLGPNALSATHPPSVRKS